MRRHESLCRDDRRDLRRAGRRASLPDLPRRRARREGSVVRRTHRSCGRARRLGLARVAHTRALMSGPCRIFHLSIPVSDLAAAKRFYVDALGATIGREHDDWLDVLLWGHQITLQHRPDEVLPPDRQGKRHFGVVLPWDEWELLAGRVRRSGFTFKSAPAIL